MITAIKSFENGNKEKQLFNTLEEAASWFNESPEAGIIAYDAEGQVIDQNLLCEMVESLN